MKGVLAPLVAIVVATGIVGLLAWAPWDARERERELEWVEAYAAWSARLDRDVARGVGASECRARFDEEVAAAPTERLDAVAEAARGRCSDVADVDSWRTSRWGVDSALIDAHEAEAETTREAQLSRIAAGIAGRPTRADCWLEGDWDALAEQYDVVYGDDFGLAGFADPVRSGIELSPQVCEPLRLFASGVFPPPTSAQNLELANALAVLAHEAEHVRVPAASEAEVECYALQRVRGLVRDAGRGQAYQEEIAGLALDYSYPYLPDEYRTELCRDGGPLDLDRGSSVWP